MLNILEDFELNRITVITGPNGCGKSTLVDSYSKHYSINKYFGEYQAEKERPKYGTYFHHYNGHGASSNHDSRGNSKFMSTFDNLKEACTSEGESLLISILNFCIETYECVQVINNLYEQIKHKDYFYKSDFETNNKYNSFYMETFNKLSIFNMRGVEGFCKYACKSSPIHYIVFDEIDSGLSLQYMLKVHSIIKNLELKLQELGIDFKIVLITTDFNTLNYFKNSNLFWLPTETVINNFNIEIFNKLFDSSSQNYDKIISINSDITRKFDELKVMTLKKELLEVM